MTDRAVIEWLCSFGGAFYVRELAPPKSTLYTWTLGAQNDVAEFLECVLPFLRVKRAQACAALDELRTLGLAA